MEKVAPVTVLVGLLFAGLTTVLAAQHYVNP
jgi:hypothetical protein